MDYMAFEQGMVTAEAKARNNANAWSRYADELKHEINILNNNNDGKFFVLNAAITLIKELIIKVEEANPNCDFADYEFVKARLEELSINEAHEDNYVLDYVERKAYKR